MMGKRYHNLEGLVRDLERAIDEDDVAEWKLLSRLDNALSHIEEASVSPEAELEDVTGDDGDDDEHADGPDESRQQLDLPGTGRMDDDVPRGTSTRPVRPDSQSVPLVGTDGLTNRPITRIVMETGRKDKRRGT